MSCGERKDMKVLFVSTEDVKYGAPKSMQKLMSTLSLEYGVECILLTKKHNLLNEWCDNHGIENYSCNYRDIMAGDSYELWWLNFAKHTIKYFRYILGKFTQSKVAKLPIDFDSVNIIHSNTNRVDIGAYLGRKYNIPHVWHLREMDEGTKNMHYYKRNWVSYMNESADCFIAITKATADSWIRHGLDKEKVKVIYNGIDPSAIVEKMSPVLQNDVIKIVAVGRIERAKGQLDIINAICDLPKELQQCFQLDFIGDAYADYKRLLKDRIEQSDCKAKINFKGYCQNIGEILQDYDIGITCSAAEAFGRTTVEYMMAGLLTIASNTGANCEIVENNVSGVIYKYGDSDSLKNVLFDICHHRECYRDYSKNAQARAKQYFLAVDNCTNIYKLYESILKEKHE